MGHTSSFVKNSTDFTKQIKECKLEEDDRMVSSDVVSLFTKVPVKEAIEVVLSRLSKDDSLAERTTLSPKSICQLAKLQLPFQRVAMNLYDRKNTVNKLKVDWLLPYFWQSRSLWSSLWISTGVSTLDIDKPLSSSKVDDHVHACAKEVL